MKVFYVYFMSNVSKMLYVGVTGNLQYRVAQHKKKLVSGYAAQYNLFKLVYFEEYSDIREAIARDKRIKGWARTKKAALIEKENPEWRDLAESWFRLPSQKDSEPSSSFRRQVCHPEARFWPKDLSVWVR